MCTPSSGWVPGWLRCPSKASPLAGLELCLIFLVFSVGTISLFSVYVLSVPGAGKGRSQECRYFIWGIEPQCLVRSFLASLDFYLSTPKV